MGTASSWTISIKPGVTQDILALESKDQGLVFSKLPVLEDDPRPDGSSKKKLKSGDGVCRLRAGNFRIFYAYDDDTVSVLQVVRRTDTTYNAGSPEAEHLPTGPGGEVPKPKASPPPAAMDWEKIAELQQTGTPLPEPLTAELLTRLKVPEALHPRLTNCKTDDALQDCPGVPPKLIERLVDYLYGDPSTRLDQADLLLAGGVDDLLKFVEGKLSAFLLKLNPEQERMTSWAIDAKGPTLVRGGPGTGKSTVALYRVKEMLRSLRASGVEHPRILFTTYTNPLITFSRELLTSLLGDDVSHVDVRTADSLVAEIADGTKVVSRGEDKQAANHAISRAQLVGSAAEVERGRATLQRLGADYLLEEFEQVILGRGLAAKEDYLAADRPGRRVPLQRAQREAVWAAYLAYDQLLKAVGLVSWAQRRTTALFKVMMGKGPRYDAVVVDEAQDLDPVTIRLVVSLVPDPGRVFITADQHQSIYGNGFRWADVHEDLRFVGRTGVLKANHRSTRQIMEAAHSYLTADGESDAPDEQVYVHEGPPPATRRVSGPDAELELLARFLRGATREFHLAIGASAVLVPDRPSGERIAEGLTGLGVPAAFMGTREFAFTDNHVHVLTMKAAKGLEFPVVALAGQVTSRYPYIDSKTGEERRAEILSRERRTMFVAMTRAMRALLIAAPEQAAPLTTGFDSTWNQ